MPVHRTRPPFSLTDALLSAYATNQAITDYLLEQLDDDAWRAEAPSGKGRTIAAIVAHMHNVRLMLLKMSKAKRVPPQLDRFKVTKAQARKALEASYEATAELLSDVLDEGEGRVAGIHREVAGLYTQLVNHDAHHRGQICMQARLAGYALPQEAQLGMWDWSKRAKASEPPAVARKKPARSKNGARSRPVSELVRG